MRKKQPVVKPSPLSDEMFSEIYSSFNKKIFNFTYRMTGDRITAEEITQDTFIRVYENYHTFKGESDLSTWIFAIAKNLSIQNFRKIKRNSFKSFEDLIKKESISSDIGQYEEFEKKLYISQVKEGCLLGLLRCLSFNQRIAFILNILFDISIKDVSGVIAKSENSTRILIHRARSNLKKFLCSNCSLYDKKNKCRCENLISFSLKHNLIGKDNPGVNVDIIDSEIREFKNEVILYKTIQSRDGNYNIKTQIRKIISNQKYSILSEKKVK
jgi:RNA polymerase sigma factor (sigma-70 family)